MFDIERYLLNACSNILFRFWKTYILKVFLFYYIVGMFKDFNLQGVYVLMSGLDIERLIFATGPVGVMQV